MAQFTTSCIGGQPILWPDSPGEVGQVLKTGGDGSTYWAADGPAPVGPLASRANCPMVSNAASSDATKWATYAVPPAIADGEVGDILVASSSSQASWSSALKIVGSAVTAGRLTVNGAGAVNALTVGGSLSADSLTAPSVALSSALHVTGGGGLDVAELRGLDGGSALQTLNTAALTAPSVALSASVQVSGAGSLDVGELRGLDGEASGG
jgi:hypothetical protein